METLVRPDVRSPRITLWLLRVVLTVHLAAVLAQPVLAGYFLVGDADALSAHGLVGGALAAVDIVVVATAALHVLLGRGRLWILPATVVLFLAVGIQIGMGHSRSLAVHIPLGVSIVTVSVLLAIWVWTPNARRTR